MGDAGTLVFLCGLAVTTWVGLSFPGCAFSLGCTIRCASQVLGLPCSPPIRVGEDEILPQLFGYRSCFVALQPDNLCEGGCQAGDVPGPGVARRDTLWGSPLVGPATPVGSGAIVSPLPTSRVPPIPEGCRTKLKRRPWPICQRERRTSSAKNSKE